MLKGKLRYRINTNHMYRSYTIYSSAVPDSCPIFKLRCRQNRHVASNSHICFEYSLLNLVIISLQVASHTGANLVVQAETKLSSWTDLDRGNTTSWHAHMWPVRLRVISNIPQEETSAGAIITNDLHFTHTPGVGRAGNYCTLT
jgi:hypothetical protein